MYNYGATSKNASDLHFSLAQRNLSHLDTARANYIWVREGWKSREFRRHPNSWGQSQSMARLQHLKLPSNILRRGARGQLA